MAFETVTLDMATTVFPSPEAIAMTRGLRLRTWVENGIGSVATIVGAPAQQVQDRLIKTTGCRDFHLADDDDLCEGLHVLRTWLNDPASYAPPARRPRPQRPEGIGQLPVPRTVKASSADTECGLCGDPVKAGDLIGRMRDPKDRRFVSMGWLCQHCLYQRRDEPRRRDVLLRVFHQMFAGIPVDLNAFECKVLLTWLTEGPDLATSGPWTKDPLEPTLVRLETSAADGKASTGFAVTTARTLIAVLSVTSTASPTERSLLDAIAQHLGEWERNPQGVEARAYGSGPRYRSKVLESTNHPTVLSARGGPFDLHQAPRNAEQPDTTDIN